MPSNYTFTQMFNEILKLAQPPRDGAPAAVGVLAIGDGSHQDKADIKAMQDAAEEHGARAVLQGAGPEGQTALYNEECDLMLARDSAGEESEVRRALESMANVNVGKLLFAAPYPPERKPLILGTFRNRQKKRDIPVLGLPYSPKSGSGKALFESFAIPAIRNMCGFPPVTTDDKFWPTLFIDAAR